MYVNGRHSVLFIFVVHRQRVLTPAGVPVSHVTYVDVVTSFPILHLLNELIISIIGINTGAIFILKVQVSCIL